MVQHATVEGEGPAADRDHVSELDCNQQITRLMGTEGAGEEHTAVMIYTQLCCWCDEVAQGGHEYTKHPSCIG